MAFDPLEKQGRTTPSAFRIAALGDTVGNFRDLKNWVGFGVDALELARAIERCDPLAEVVEGQRIPLCDRSVRQDYKGFRSAARVKRLAASRHAASLSTVSSTL